MVAQSLSCTYVYCKQIILTPIKILWEGSNCAPSTIFLPRIQTFVTSCFAVYMLQSLLLKVTWWGANSWSFRSLSLRVWKRSLSYLDVSMSNLSFSVIHLTNWRPLPSLFSQDLLFERLSSECTDKVLIVWPFGLLLYLCTWWNIFIFIYI